MWIKNWIKRSPLIAYFVFVFGIEWLLFFALSEYLPPMIALLIGSWLPNIIGVFITGTASGRKGLREMFSKIMLWRIHFKWYLIATILPILLTFLSIWLYELMGNVAPVYAPGGQIPLILVISIFTGAMGEELGWRGTALPRLQARRNALTSSLVLGILWGLYHLPSFLMSGLPLEDAPLIPFMLCALGLTFLVTWSFNHTRGSLIIVFLYHFAFNFMLNATGVTNDPALLWILGVVSIVVASAIVIFDWKHFTREMDISTEDTWIIED